jgi:hypothetical protein
MSGVAPNPELLPGSILTEHEGGLEKEEGGDTC